MASGLRVLLVTDWMPRSGGAEAYAASIRERLAAAGDDVRLLTSSAGSAANGTADFVAYGTTHHAGQAGLQIVNPFAVQRAWSAVRTFQPDVALVHLFAYHLSPAVLWPLRSVPTVLTVLDYKVVCPLGSKLLPDGTICEQRAGVACWRSGCLPLAHWIRDQVRYAGIAHATRQPQLVLACSRHMVRQLEAHGIAATHIELPVAAPGGEWIRRPAPHPHFVFCGRLSVEKGVPLLVRAFARLHSQMPQARLTIVGDGPARDEVVAAVDAHDIQRAVTMTGWLEPSAVDRELEGAWAVVAPSLWAEPLGMIGLEAVIRSIPVIASSTGGFGETIEDGVSGLLVANGDEHALHRALERVASGAAFAAHRLDPQVVARTAQSASMDRHITVLRRHLHQVAGRAAA